MWGFLYTRDFFQKSISLRVLGLKGLVHYSLDGVFQEGSIFKCFTTICERIGLIWMAQSHQKAEWYFEKLLQMSAMSMKIKGNHQLSKEINEIQRKVMKFSKILGLVMSL